LRGCQIFLGKTYQNGKIYRNNHKISNNGHIIGIPKRHKIDQMAVNYTNISHCKTLQNLPKMGFLV
jgi:hypothetical protein